jgi:hypothetical protein
LVVALDMAGADVDEKEADEGNVEEDDPDAIVVDILRSFPRPLMPLLEFLYRRAKYSHKSLSCDET